MRPVPSRGGGGGFSTSRGIRRAFTISNDVLRAFHCQLNGFINCREALPEFVSRNRKCAHLPPCDSDISVIVVDPAESRGAFSPHPRTRHGLECGKECKAKH